MSGGTISNLEISPELQRGTRVRPGAIRALTLALLCTGCMTVDTLNNPGYHGPWTYSGTRADAELISQTFLSWNLPVMIWFMLDLPLSAVADTLALPVTLPRERTRVADLEQSRRVDIEQPAPIRAEPGEAPEATAQRLFEHCRSAVRRISDELIDCYSIDARIRLRPAADATAAARELSGAHYKLELREALERQRYSGEILDWKDVAFEREGDAVRVTATRSSSFTPVTHPQRWLIGPGADGGWRILEQEGVAWRAPESSP